MVDVRHEVLRQFKLCEDAKLCGRCRQKILEFTNEREQQRQAATKLMSTEPFKNNLSTARTTCVMLGRPRVMYTDASGPTKQRMLSSAKHLVSDRHGWEMQYYFKWKWTGIV